MSATGSLHEQCRRLLSDYPLAVEDRSMVLMLRPGPQFFILSERGGRDAPSYSVHPWRQGGGAGINSGNAVPVAAEVAQAVTDGVPLPWDGSLFGWKDGDRIAGLLVFRTQYSPECPVPRYSAMPLAGIAERRWPAFCGADFGPWFWEGVRAGGIADLAGLVAAAPRTIFWADTQAVTGSDSCVVTSDVRSSKSGVTLPAGVYTYCDVLRGGQTPASLAELAAASGKTDLAPQFRNWGRR